MGNSTLVESNFTQKNLKSRNSLSNGSKFAQIEFQSETFARDSTSPIKIKSCMYLVRNN